MTETSRSAWTHFLQEHERLRAWVERIRETADAVGAAPATEIRDRLTDLHGFLSHELLLHIAREERILYRALARVEGLREAAETLRRDHAAITELVRELAELQHRTDHGKLGRDEESELRRVLYGMYTLLTVHMGEEEDVCIPALDRALTDGQIRLLTQDLDLFEEAAQAAW